MDAGCRGVDYWLYLHGLFRLLSYALRDHGPMLVPPTMGQTFLQQPLIKKMHYRFLYRPVLRRHFLNWESLLSYDSNACQIDTKLANTIINANKIRQIVASYERKQASWRTPLALERLGHSSFWDPEALNSPFGGTTQEQAHLELADQSDRMEVSWARDSEQR